MAEADGETEGFYERRLDRGPEKQEFNQLPSPEKRLVSQLRSAMVGAREKFTQLRDELDDKERDASRESALRKAAETRLEQLVDMYGDPAVMSELKERLPRASSNPDPRITWQKELDEMYRKEAAARDQDEQSPSPKRKGKTEGERRSHSPPRGSSHPSSYPGYPPPLGPYYPPPSAFYPPPPQGYPLHPPPQIVYMQAPPSGQTGAASAPGGPFPAASPVAGQGDVVDGKAAGSGSVPGQTTRDAAASREQNRQISLLLTELDATRDLNKKLQAELSSVRLELESLRVSTQTKEAVQKAEDSGKLAALVEEIYRAQKVRDEAMMGRLRNANEERDEALIKLRKMEERVAEFDLPERDTIPDMLDTNISELLGSIADGDGFSPDHDGRRLLETLDHTRRRHHAINTEEMKAVLEERDNAVAKCQRLEAELIRVQRQSRGRTPDRQQTATMQKKPKKSRKALLAKLLTTQQERDMALTKLRKKDEELQTLRVYYSLHKSLSQEANLRDQFNNTLETYQGQLKHQDSVRKENNRLLAQLNAALGEKAIADEQMTKMAAKQQNLEDANAKLEKVVSLLRERIKDMAPPIED